MLCVIVIILSLFMMLLKIIMRERNMVVEIFMLGKHLSPCWKSQRCSCFTFLCLIICAAFIYFLSRCPCIGSMLEINVVYIFYFDSLLCASTFILLLASLHSCLANGFKEALIG